jgi:hypothetical protein
MTELRQRQPRQKDAKHLDYIRSLPCCVCGDNTSTEAAHIRVASLEHGKNHTGMAEKSSDKWALPLCGECHREQHSMNELKFWASYNINPFTLAIKLRAPRS